MTTELVEENRTYQEFSLDQEFDWDSPIPATAQAAVALYGNDEDRLRLIAHASVLAETLESLALVPSIEVRFAVAQNVTTPLESLMRLTRDHVRPIKAAANATVDSLPEDRRLLARSMAESPIQRLRSRRQASRAAA